MPFDEKVFREIGTRSWGGEAAWRNRERERERERRNEREQDGASESAIRTGGYLRSYRQPITFVEPENVGSYSTMEQPGPQIINQTITPRLYRFPSPFRCARVPSRQTQSGKRETVVRGGVVRAFKLVHHRVGYASRICLVVRSARRG